MQFIFVRHGQSEANAAGIIGDSTTPLTDQGKGQAQQTGVNLKDKNITTILCSPFLRARQTTEIIATELGLPTTAITIIDDLQERGTGELVNKPKTHESEWYYITDSAEGEEKCQALLERMTRALNQIKAVKSDGMLLVVGHAVSGFYLQQVAAGKTSLDQLDPPTQMNNADHVLVKTK